MLLQYSKQVKKKNKVLSLLFWAGLLVAFIFGNTETSLAGEINANEAKIIAAAQNTFSYKNKYYVAKTSYLQQLRSELSADDVDLSSTEADDAITEMYGSVKEGINQGYLQCVGTKTNNSSASMNEEKKAGSQNGQEEKEKEEADIVTDIGGKNEPEDAIGVSEEKTQQEKEIENSTGATAGIQVVEIEETSKNLPQLMSIQVQQFSDNAVFLEASEKAVVTGPAIDSENSGRDNSLYMFIVLGIGAIVSGFLAYRKM